MPPRRKPAPAERWENRIVGQDDVAPAELTAHPANARQHPDAQRRALGQSLDRVGWVAPIIVNKRTGRIVDGHARVEEAVTAGAASVPVTYVDLDDEEERFVLATLDPISTMAETDSDAMAALLDGLEVGDGPLAGLLDELAGGGADDSDRATPETIELPLPERVYVLVSVPIDRYGDLSEALALAAQVEGVDVSSSLGS